MAGLTLGLSRVITGTTKNLSLGGLCVEIDRPRQSHRFLETCLRRAAAIAPLPRHLERWVNDQGASNRRALGVSCRSRQTSRNPRTTEL